MYRIYLVAVGLIFSSISYGVERAPPSGTPELRIQKIHAGNSISVTLSPANKGVTRIWRSGNSWGAANWRVFIVRGAELFAFREDPDQRFSRNAPMLDELKGARQSTIELNSELWIGPKNEFGAFRSGDQVIVAYDVPVTMEARLYGVWYGTTSAMLSVK